MRLKAKPQQRCVSENSHLARLDCACSLGALAGLVGTVIAASNRTLEIIATPLARGYSLPFWIKSGYQPGDIEFSRLRALTHDFAERRRPREKNVAIDVSIAVSGGGACASGVAGRSEHAAPRGASGCPGRAGLLGAPAYAEGAPGYSGDGTAVDEWSHCTCE